MVSNDGKSLTFFTPAQPHIEDWKKKDLALYLQVKRPEAPKVEEAVSLKRFPFHYASHARIPSDLPLCFHDDSPDEASVDNGRHSRATSEDANMVTSSLPKQTGPGLKRRILHKEKTEDSAKVSKKDLAPSQPPQQPGQELTGTETGVAEPEAPAHHVSESAEHDEGSGVDSSTVQISAHQSILEHIPNDLFLFLFSNATSEDMSGSAANELQRESSESPWMNLAAPDRPSHFGAEDYVHQLETTSVRSVQHNPTHEDLLATDNEGMILCSKNTKLYCYVCISVVAGSFFLADPHSSNETEADGHSNAAHSSQLSASMLVNKPKSSRPKGFGRVLTSSESARGDLKKNLASLWPILIGVGLSLITTSFLKWNGWV